MWLTIDEMASRTGMARRQILRIEQGRYTVSFTKRDEIAVALGYTLGDLLLMEPVTSAITA